MSTPIAGSYPAYFFNYIKLVETASITEAIEKYSKYLNDFFLQISEEKSTYRYAENKWSIKEMLQHIIDCERIFVFRALSIARGEQTPLPGFEENDYALASKAGNRSWQSLTEEFAATRKSTDLMLQSFTEEQLNSSGTTNGNANTTVAIAFVIFGHALHHISVVKEKYLR